MNNRELEKLMGIEDETDYVPVTIDLVEVDSNFSDREPDLELDYSESRKHFHFQQQMLLEMSKYAMQQVYHNEGSPRSIEVFSGLMSTYSDVNSKILDMQDKLNKMMGVTGKVIEAEAGSNSVDMIDKHGSRQDIKRSNNEQPRSIPCE